LLEIKYDIILDKGYIGKFFVECIRVSPNLLNFGVNLFVLLSHVNVSLLQHVKPVRDIFYSVVYSVEDERDVIFHFATEPLYSVPYVLDFDCVDHTAVRAPNTVVPANADVVVTSICDRVSYLLGAEATASTTPTSSTEVIVVGPVCFTIRVLACDETPLDSQVRLAEVVVKVGPGRALGASTGEMPGLVRVANLVWVRSCLPTTLLGGRSRRKQK
jgi:hypothetical protein